MAAQCTIARDNKGEIQEVYAPNQKPSRLFRDAVEAINDSSKAGKDKALKIWARAYTPTFKDKFGDWEIISQAIALKDGITGIYKNMMDVDPQRVLFEAAIQVNSSVAEGRAASKTFGLRFTNLALELYPNVRKGDIYVPVVSRPIDENGEPLVSQILRKTEKTQQTKVEVTPNLDISMLPTNVAERMSKKMGIPFELDGNLNRMATIRGGKVMFNPNYFTLESVFHEFTHPFILAIQKSNPSLYNNLVGRAKNFTYNGMNLNDFVKQEYPELVEGSDEFNHEVITTAIGLQASGAVVEDKVKFANWLKTVWQKITDYINSLTEDPTQKIEPADLDPNMRIKDLAELMKLDNVINLDSIDVATIQADQVASATTVSWGSTKTIDEFKAKEQSINLVETPTESYYTDGTIDPITNTLRKYSRLTGYTHENFAVTKYGDEYNSEKAIDDAAKNAFEDAGAALTDKINFRDSAVPMGFDQVKERIRKDSDKARMRGKVIHKMIEGFVKEGDKDFFGKEITEFMDKGDLSERHFWWFDDNKIKNLLTQLGIKGSDSTDTDVEFRDNIASELMMTNSDLGIGTANDFFVEHSDGYVSLMDFKTGVRFLDDEDTKLTLMQHSKGLSKPIVDSKLNRAKVELVMRMIMAKMNKPDLKVRDLKIAHITKHHGNQIRHVAVQQYLDYINNNMRLQIQNLTKAAQKDPSLKDDLAQKKKEYAAMKAANVFDFQHYAGPSNIFEQDETLSTITDPVKRFEKMKERISKQGAESLVHNKSIRESTLDQTKKFLYGVLNNFVSKNEDKLESAERKDIGGLASRVSGLRDQNNAFLKAFSRFFEDSTTKVTEEKNKILGEQSAFRKADRALHKEYYERTGKPKFAAPLTFSFAKQGEVVEPRNQGLFDFMYTWKTVGDKPARVGAVYTEADVKAGKITQVQWEYYKASKAILKSVYEGVMQKTAYLDKSGKPVTYRTEYNRNNYSYESVMPESFLPVIPFQNQEEIIEKNVNSGVFGSLTGAKGLVKDMWENYQDRYNLAIQNEFRFNIGLPLKYMSNDYLTNDEHSFNVSTGIDLFASHMINKLEMDDVYNIGKLTEALMKDDRDDQNVDKLGRLKQENAVYHLNSFLEQHLLGRRRVTSKYTGNAKVNIGIDRSLDNISSFISKNAFWLAPVTSFANGIYGVFTNLKEGFVGSVSKRFFGDENAVTLSHILAAMKESGIHQGVNLTKNSKVKRQLNEDWEGTYYKDKVNFMAKQFRLNNKSYAFRDDSLMLNVHNRVFTQDSAYFMQAMGEDFSNETLVIAAMKARKVAVTTGVDSLGQAQVKYLKKDGSYTTDSKASGLENMWDVYKYNETTKEYEYTGPVRFKDKDGNDVKGMTSLEQLRVKQFLERMYGSYSPEQRTALERYAWGRALMKFRKFQILNFRENFTLNSHQQYLGEYKQLFNADMTPKLKDGQPMYDWESQRTRARLQIFAAMIGGWANTKDGLKWSKMTEDEKKQMVRLGTQLVFLAFLWLGGVAALVPPEDKDKMYVKRSNRLAQDLSQIDPIDILRGTAQIDSYPELLIKGADAATTFFKSILTDDIVKSGPYKGDYKGWNTLEDFIPIYHPYNQTVKLVTGG